MRRRIASSTLLPQSAAFDAVDWVFWAADDRRRWEAQSHELAGALEMDPERLWDWCTAFAALLAASAAMRSGTDERVEALLQLAA